MWKKKPPKVSFIDNCLSSILAINQILKDCDYFANTAKDEQRLKVTVEEETDTVVLELKLHEQIISDFIANLKQNSLTKHIPVMKVSKSNTQIFWDQLNQTGNCFENIKPGKNPWLLVKINSVTV